jgi:hypothetical protein
MGQNVDQNIKKTKLYHNGYSIVEYYNYIKSTIEQSQKWIADTKLDCGTSP